MEHTKYNNYTNVFKIPFAEIDKIDMALCKEPRETLESYYNRQTIKPDLLINGGFFSMVDGTTCFNFRDEDTQIASHNQYQWGIGIIGAKDIRYGSLKGGTSWRDFISGYPNLIDNYKKVPITFAKEINYNARRSVLGFGDNNLFIVAIDKPGMTFAAMQNMCAALGMRYAINLDGGGSTRVLKEGKLITSEPYSRPVDNVVAVYLTKAIETPNAEQRVLYRTQVGAYSQRANAENMLVKIKALGGVYTNAYVKNVGGLWKVQVGCFAIKTNAERMRDDLKSKGFNCFITTK